MIRRVRKIVREIDSLEASKLRKYTLARNVKYFIIKWLKQKIDNFAILQFESGLCVSGECLLDSSCYDIYKHIRCKQGINAMLHGAIFLATCNAILLLRDVN
jgi:hypothetical protein